MKLIALLCLFVSTSMPAYSKPDHPLLSPYSAPFWLPSGHLQTLYPAVLRPHQTVQYKRERWELADGDFIDTDWILAENTDLNRPIVVLFHGLEGSSNSQYAKAVMAATLKKGWRGVVIHFRGCSGEPNRLPRAYYAGDTQEIDMMLSKVRQQAPNAPIFAVGFSLGGNALLKWLGESGEHANNVINKAIAVSAPIDLAASANALDTGLNQYLYTPNFVSTLKPKALEMAERFPGLLDTHKIKLAKTIYDIDNAFTAVLYGAADAQQYYAENAAKPWLTTITLPTLILNAKNDPFIPAESLPTTDAVSSTVTLEYPDTGGHVGFSGQGNWLPNRIMYFFDN